MVLTARRGHGPKDDRGDTLVEVLVAIVIVGTAVAALLGGLLTSTAASVSHRNVATIDAVLSSFAETARSSIELQSTGDYAPCSPGNPVNYTVVGSPNPRSGPPGSVVDVFGTGFPSLTPNGTIVGASFGGNSLAATAAPSSTAAGAISDFTVPSMPAGTYSLTPFDSSHPAASSFTITPWVGDMNPAVPGSTGPGTRVRVSVSGFSAGATLGVTVGTTTLPAAAVTGNPTAADGSGTLVFTIPSPLSGNQVSQPVTISDGTNLASSVALAVSADTGVANQKVTISPFFTNYTLAMSVAYWNSGNWTTDTTKCTGAGFNPDIQQLNLTLRDTQAGNGADGGASVVVANFLPQSVPAPPVGLIASSYQSGQVPLTWDAPGYSGTSPITGYNIYESTSSGSIGTNIKSVGAGTTSYTVPGLTNGTTYYFEVTATNNSGEGAPSAPQVSALPAAPPSAPNNVNAQPGNTTVTVNWTAPTSTGGAAITGYNIYRSTASGTQGTLVTTTAPGATSYTDTGLTNGTPYFYTVRAVNPAGIGTASPQVSATPEPPPGAPTALLAAPGNGQISLSWTAPLPNGGPAVMTYNVYRSTNAGSQGTVIGSTPGGTTTFVDSTVSNGTPYYYEVTAVNSIGEGSPSTQVSATPFGVATTPSAPIGLTAAAGNSRGSKVISLAWSPPLSNGGTTLTGYNVYRSTTGLPRSFGSPIATGVGATSYTDSSVTKNTNYWYYVTAVNAVGEGPASNTAGPVTP